MSGVMDVQIAPMNLQPGRWDGTHGTPEFCPFIEAYSFTELLAPKEKKTQIKKEHWQWEVATVPWGLKPSREWQAGEQATLQRGSLAKDAQRADCPSSLSRDGTPAARSQHARTWGVGLVEPESLGPANKPLSCLVSFHFGETGFIRQDGMGEGAQVLMSRG